MSSNGSGSFWGCLVFILFCLVTTAVVLFTQCIHH
jgi:uncharacterized membrane protein